MKDGNWAPPCPACGSVVESIVTTPAGVTIGPCGCHPDLAVYATFRAEMTTAYKSFDPAGHTRAPALTDFLLARIAEDETVAARIECVCDSSSPTEWQAGCPERVLAECEAKRRLVKRHADWIYEEECRGCSCADGGTCWLLRGLGIVYADHPDYREEWKP